MGKVITAIPYYESDEGKRDVLKKCLVSIEGQQDEIIVLSGKQPTLINAWNQLLELSFAMGADYCILSNDDIELQSGKLRDLCILDQVVSPLVNGSVYKVFHAHMFALPRSVYEKIGGFDPKFSYYWADTDYSKRLVDAGISVVINDNVKILHNEPTRTLKTFSRDSDNVDEEIFKIKWGRTYFDPPTGK